MSWNWIKSLPPPDPLLDEAPPLPPKKNNMWAISLRHALKRYGSYTGIIEEMFRYPPPDRSFHHGIEKLIFMYLKEQYDRNNEERDHDKNG